MTDPATVAVFSVTGLGAGVLGHYIWGRFFREGGPPTAGSTIPSGSHDGAIALDKQGRIVDFDGAAADILPELEGSRDRRIRDICPRLLDVAESKQPLTPGESRGGKEEGAVFRQGYRVTTIEGAASQRCDRLIILADVSGQLRRESVIETLQELTHQLLEATSRSEVQKIVDGLFPQAFPGGTTALYTFEGNDDVLVPVTCTNGEGGSRAVEPGDTLWSVVSGATPAIFMADGGIIEISSAPVQDRSLSARDMDLLDDRHIKRDDQTWAIAAPVGKYGLFLAGGTGDLRMPTVCLYFVEILSRVIQTTLNRLDYEAELRGKQEEIQEKKDQIEFFNGVLRHDILNGLNVLKAHIGFLEGHVDEEGQGHVNTLEEWCSDMTELTRTIRQINATVSEEGETNLKKVDLSKVLDNRVSKVRGENGVSIETDIDPDLVVRANDLLGEVIENLLVNARVHAADETGSVRISVATECTPDTVTVKVGDNGPGIPDGQEEEIFERGESSRGDEGGFGLYFVRLMARQYGGDVRAGESALGGAEISVRLQRIEPEEWSQHTERAAGR